MNNGLIVSGCEVMTTQEVGYCFIVTQFLSVFRVSDGETQN